VPFSGDVQSHGGSPVFRSANFGLPAISAGIEKAAATGHESEAVKQHFDGSDMELTRIDADFSTRRSPSLDSGRSAFVAYYEFAQSSFQSQHASEISIAEEGVSSRLSELHDARMKNSFTRGKLFFTRHQNQQSIGLQLFRVEPAESRLSEVRIQNEGGRRADCNLTSQCRKGSSLLSMAFRRGFCAGPDHAESTPACNLGQIDFWTQFLHARVFGLLSPRSVLLLQE